MIIINDSRDEWRAGDVRIYKDLSIALSSLEEEDLVDKSINIYDLEGRRIKLSKSISFNGQIEASYGEILGGLESVLRENARLLAIDIENCQGIDDLALSIFVKNPDPYT